MKRFKGHIIVLLLGIFFFPIIAQFAHALEHHLHVKARVELSYTLSETQDSVSQTDLEDERCPICEYQFSVNDLHQLNIFSSVISERSFEFTPMLLSRIPQALVLKHSNRAPPVIFS